MQSLQRALQFLILGVLVSFSCGKKTKIPTSGPAGDVQAIEGSVTATRDGEAPRTLALADLVYVNDTIATSAGSSVRIRLNHNQADWSMEASSKKRITQGLAWRATSKGAGSFSHADEVSTGAAGRSAGKQAAAHKSELSNDQGTATLDRESVATGGNAPSRAEPVMEAASPGEAEKRIGVSQSAKSHDGAGRRRVGAGQKKKLDETRSFNTRAPQKRKAKAAKQQQGRGLNLELAITESADREDESASPPPAPIPTSPQGASADSPVANKAWINELARQCHRTNGGSGTLSYSLVIVNGSLKRFTTPDTPDSLLALAKCMQVKIEAKDLGKKQSLDGAISF